MLRSLLVSGALVLVGAPVAQASTSTNWSGYVAHGARFSRVAALWTQPSATCTPGYPSYSAAWVGLGGYRLTARAAIEQIGTEADCSASGTEISSAWFELVPAPSRQLRMVVNPGDVMAGRVTVIGNRVTLALTDRTRHKSYTKTVTDSRLDVTSADWIVEAPSQCGGNGQCQPLALANFGSETFARAQVQTVSGQSGSISSKLWRTDVISLSPGNSGRSFAGNGADGGGTSSPSELTSSGTSFSLTYSPIIPTVAQPQPAYRANFSPSAGVSAAAGLDPGGVRR